MYIGVDQFRSDDWAKTLVHEYTHFEEGTKEYAKMQKFLLSDNFKLDGKTVAEIAENTVFNKGYAYTREQIMEIVKKGNENVKSLSENEKLAYIDFTNEVTAHTTEAILGNEAFIDNLLSRDESMFKKLFDRVRGVRKALTDSGETSSEQIKKLRKAEKLYLKAAEKAGNSKLISYIRDRIEEGEGVTAESHADGVQASIKTIVGPSGKNYGTGVFLDSSLLENLSDADRRGMVKESITTELAGQHFIAYDDNGDAVDIRLATKSEKIRKTGGKKYQVLNELYRKNIHNEVKQEAVVLVDELIEASKYHKSKASNYGHGWLDNYGKNDFEYWKVFVQEKNKTVWEANLNVANTANGEKILYDVDPIKKVEGAVKSAPATTDNSIPQNDPVVNSNSMQNAKKNSQGSKDSGIQPSLKAKNAEVESDDSSYQNGNEITKKDIDVLRTIPRKSINDFTSEEIQKTELWARKFYKELRTKSPFFRAWFGDWRAHDNSKFKTVTAKLDSSLKSGKAKNADTQKVVSWSAHDIRGESLNHAVKEKVALEALNQISEIVEEAVLLDTVVSSPSSKSKMPNTAFMHSFYTIYENGNGKYLLKLYVEEALSNKGNEVFTRAYELKDIEKVADIQSGVHSQERGLTTDKPATIDSISDLFKFVKRYDKEFSPKAVNPLLLNDNGTPKVFYHGTFENWTVYDLTKNANQQFGEGIYLTESKERARLYGDNIMPLYVRAMYDYRSAKANGTTKDYSITKNGDLIVYDPTQIKSATDNIGTFDGKNSDIRFSLKKINSAPNTLESYTEKEYNSFGWVRYNDIIPSGAWTDFNSKFAALKSGQSYFRKTKANEYIIPVNDRTVEGENIDNILVYAKGSLTTPVITKIVKINFDDETLVDIVRSEIYESQGIFRYNYFDGVLESYDAKDFPFWKARRERDGQSSSTYEGVQDGRGTSGETEGTIKASPKGDDSTSKQGTKILTDEQAISSYNYDELVKKSAMAITPLIQEIPRNENGKIDKKAVVDKGKENANKKKGIKRKEYSDYDLDKNICHVANMEAVHQIPASKLDKTGRAPSVLFDEFFREQGNSIYTEELGDVSLSNSSRKSEIRHGLTAEKIASIEAIPFVLRNGKVVFVGEKTKTEY